MVKRILDVACSLLALIVLSPILILITFLLVITNKGKPFFFQTRSGLHGRPFTIYKFKTMQDSSDKIWDPEKDLERLTPIGKILRDFSIDEFPQLWNVLLGDMSLVGPRPLPIEYFPLYSEEQKGRFRVKPGITGWAQVNGRNEITWEERFRLDNWYADNQSLKLDLIILFKSMFYLFSRRGINKSKNLTMPKFTGSKI
ncbi:MAG: sugar transferase [Cytophagales bacterium]|nr:sugar transferase [Cytophagales bacterium]